MKWLRALGGALLIGGGAALTYGGWHTLWLDPTNVLPFGSLLGALVLIVGFVLLPAATQRGRWLKMIFGGLLVIGAVGMTSSAFGIGGLLTVLRAQGISVPWQNAAERLQALRFTSLIPATFFSAMGVAILWRQGSVYISNGKRDVKVVNDPNAIVPADVILARDEQDRPIYSREPDRYMHTLVAGPTGSGKTSTSLSPMVVQDLANTRVGVTLLEPKGDWIAGDSGRPGVLQWAEHYGRTVYLIDPNNPDTDVFNPLVGDRHMVAEVNTTTLKALFGDQNPFFAQTQESLLKKTLYLLKWVKGDDLTYWDLYRAIQDFNVLVAYTRELKRRVTYWKYRGPGGCAPGLTPDDMAEAEDLINWFRTRTADKAGEKLKEHVLGLYVQLDNLMNNQYFRRCIVPPNKEPEPQRPDPSHSDYATLLMEWEIAHKEWERRRRSKSRVIDMDKHLANGSVLAVSTNDGRLMEYSKTLGTMIVTAFQYAASRRFDQPAEERHPHIIYIDEAPTYLTPQWADFQAKARGFNIGIVLAWQANSQLDKVERGFMDTIIGQCRTRLIYGGLPEADVNYWMKSFGTKIVEEKSEGVSERYRPIPSQGGILDLFIPTSFKEVNRSTNTRMVEKTRLSFNDIWELPRGRVLLQQVVGGSVQPPRFAKVGVVTELPPKVGNVTVPWDAGLIDPKGPVIPEVPAGVDATPPLPTEEGELENATPKSERKQAYTERDLRRDRADDAKAKGQGRRSKSSLVSQLGISSPKQVTLPLDEPEGGSPAKQTASAKSQPKQTQGQEAILPDAPKSKAGRSVGDKQSKPVAVDEDAIFFFPDNSTDAPDPAPKASPSPSPLVKVPDPVPDVRQEKVSETKAEDTPPPPPQGSYSPLSLPNPPAPTRWPTNNR